MKRQTREDRFSCCMVKGAFLFALMMSSTALFCPSALCYPRTPGDLIEMSCGGDNGTGKRILIAYDTIHGSTAEVAERIGEDLCSMGFQVDVRLALHVAAVDEYDGVIIASAVYEFQWLPDSLAFLEKNRHALAAVPTAVFIVGASMSQDTPETRAAVQKSFVDPVLSKFPEITPVSIGLFGGAFDFTKEQYTLFEKIVLRILGNILHLPDKNKADWRDWDTIHSWAEEVGTLMR